MCLNAATRQIYSLYNDTYVNAQTMVELMEWLRKDHRYRRIFLILDNARYLKCEFVRKMAAKYRINLVYLPPYSPNLNLIERLWKYLKKQVLAGKYYGTRKDFEQAIIGFFEQINLGDHDVDLARLITLNFQTLNTDNNFSQN